MTQPANNKGLTSEEAKKLLEKYGKNELITQKKQSFFKKVLHIISEPMFMMLLIAAVIYFILGEARDGLIMLIFVVGIISIDVIQEWKTDKTLTALRDLSAPHVTVIRDGTETVVPSTELVPGDLILISEGVKIPADGYIVRCSDLCTDESSLTGEAEGVWKIPEGDWEPSGDHWRKDYCYAGTLVTQGSATLRVDRTGASTEFGKIGQSLALAPDDPTPLQKQTGSLVKTCAIIAIGLFILVGIVTWFNIPDHTTGPRLIESILSGITLAMAMIPEEFPVILTVFLSLGAWRLARKHSLVRRLPSVETLGAVSVLCVDKTGTLTMNQMTVQQTWAPEIGTHTLCEVMGLACETETYDPMEQAMLKHCEEQGLTRETLFSSELITEYPFTNALKMMGHVWRRGGIIIAAKGSPERILPLCEMREDARLEAEMKSLELSKQGLRVIAVGMQRVGDDADIPSEITGCHLTLCGLVGLADPPRPGVKENIETCRRAGLRVVMITGDNGITAASIARQVGMESEGHIMTGDELEQLSDEALRARVRDVNIFSRVVPEHKMRIVRALKENGEIVAMTGDGVNDAPALKYADIGIAMGGRGSEVSREAADLILLDDNFSTIVETISDGRRIYDNIRKAVGYVFTIHIPIALSSLLAPMLGINPSALMLLPLHVVLLELLIDPTCSVVLERQPAETDIMERPPRDPKRKLLSGGTIAKSLTQGFVLFAASFGTYLRLLDGDPANAPLARAAGLAVVILGNLFLVQVNSSDHDFAAKSIRRLMGDRVMWGVTIGTIVLLVLALYSPLGTLLRLAPLSGLQLLAVLGISVAAVFWYEIVKAVRRILGK